MRPTPVGRWPLVAIGAWLSTRLIVLVSLAAAHLLVSRLMIHRLNVTMRVHQGFLAWDGGWYQSIAAHGYRAAGEESSRFFPLFPLLGRLFAYLGPSPGISLVIIANLSALLVMVLFVKLAQATLSDAEAAERSLWLFAVAPGAYVLVLGYAEALFLALVLGIFLILKQGAKSSASWAAIAGLAFMAAFARPLGLALLPAIGLVAFRSWKSTHRVARSVSLIATFAPALAVFVVMAISAANFHTWLAPFQSQLDRQHHGRISNPASTVMHALGDATHGHLAAVMHLPWIMLAIFGLFFAWKTLPGEQTIFAAGVVLLALSGSNLDSFERYAECAFPLFFVAGSLLRSSL
ncbi:MAG: hypothetical protein WCO31_06590, partial [Actinomycetes bacterium]